ncbi:hypothetical protein BC829DRAFT_440049 [Chytridium lagenaria]|nr:hypothetical protein BC829DRAFT_440049 [Chytridium lagenaria]
MDFPPTHSADVFLHDDREVLFEGFERYFTFDSFDVRRRLVPSSGLYEYKALGSFPTVNAETLISVYLDFEYRKFWDPHVLEGYPISERPITTTIPLFSEDASCAGRQSPSSAVSPGADSGVEMKSSVVVKTPTHDPKYYYYAIKMPFPLATRDYVYSLRCWSEGTAFLVEGKSIRDLPVQKLKGGVRIEDYYQQIAVKNIPGNGGTLMSMRYYDDPKGAIPPFILNMAAQKGVPSFVAGITKAAENYSEWLKKRG